MSVLDQPDRHAAVPDETKVPLKRCPAHQAFFRRAMRSTPKHLVLFSLGVLQMLAASVSSQAADLSLKPAKKHAVRIHHHKSAAVRDYDGTPIVLRRVHPLIVRTERGSIIYRLYEADPVQAEPTRYLNGQPVGGNSFSRALRLAAAERARPRWRRY